MRGLAALVLALCAGLLACSGKHGPCTPQIQASIQAHYAAQVLALCAKASSVAACPEGQRLRDERRKAQLEALCR